MEMIASGRIVPIPERKLKHYAARHEQYIRMVEKHPEMADYFRRKIEENKGYILDHIMSHRDQLEYVSRCGV